MTDYRANFDAEVMFSNGGGLTAKGFRLDISSRDITEEQLAEAFVRHLGLLMVQSVTLENVSVLAEPHKGSRGGPADAADASEGGRLVELNHVIEQGMTTYPGLPGPEITAHLTREASRSIYSDGTEFEIDIISMIGNTGTYLDSPFHRYADGADLAGLPLDAVANLPTVVVRLLHELGRDRGIDSLALAPYDVKGAAVLLHTGWDRHWRCRRRAGSRGSHVPCRSSCATAPRRVSRLRRSQCCRAGECGRCAPSSPRDGARLPRVLAGR